MLRVNRLANYRRASFTACFIVLALSTSFSQLAEAQGLPNNPGLSPINLAATQIAQAAPAPQFIPTDVTPYTTTGERNLFAPEYKFRIFQSLPERLWFNTSTEVSQRLDTNVLFTYDRPKADYAFRVLPNLTVGYDIFKNTAVYMNYFVIKDVFARYGGLLTFPTTQSLSWGIRHTKQLGQKTILQFDMQARELWQTSNLRWFDFLPGVTLTHTITPRKIIFASALLQMRGANYFVAPTRELDPFYTIGYLASRGSWNFVVTDTFVTNFRDPPFTGSVPHHGNVSMITDIEINHPVTKRFPSLVAFIRAEPVWNWDSGKVAGISGFDFRLFGGLRFTINKPSYYGAIDNLRKQLILSGTHAPPLTSALPVSTNNQLGSSAVGSLTQTENDQQNQSSPNAPALIELRPVLPTVP